MCVESGEVAGDVLTGSRVDDDCANPMNQGAAPYLLSPYSVHLHTCTGTAYRHETRMPSDITCSPVDCLRRSMELLHPV